MRNIIKSGMLISINNKDKYCYEDVVIYVGNECKAN